MTNLQSRNILVFLFLWSCLIIHSHTNIFSILDASHGLSDNQVQHILQLPDNRMVFTTSGNINIYDGAHFRYIHKKDSIYYPLPAYKGAYHVYVGKRQLLWVKDYKKLLCLDLRKECYISDLKAVFLQMGVKEQVLDLFVDSQKDIWLVTSQGLLQTSTYRYFSLPSNSGNLQDIDVLKDRLYLFFETGEVVCYKLTNGTMLYQKAAYPASHRSLFGHTSLIVKGPDNLFYQIRNGSHAGFFSFNPEIQCWKKLLEVPYVLHTLFISPQNRAYITCNKGLWQIELTDSIFKFEPTLSMADGSQLNTGLNTIFGDTQGGLWIGTYNKGLLYTHPSRYRFTSYQQIDSIIPDWEKYQPISRVIYQGQQYNTVYTDSRQWTWAGTPDGLRLFLPNTSTFKTFYSENGLTNNFIHSIIEDRQNNIWIGTSHGISHIKIGQSPEDLIFTGYRSDEGTLKGEYVNGVAFMLPNGKICMKGVEGWTVFQPDSIQPYTHPLHPILTGVALHGESLSIGKKCGKRILLPEAAPYTSYFDMEYNQNSISFDFSALNYVHPEQTYYKYRIKEKDEDWHIVKGNQANGMVDARGLLHLSFINLESGIYHLQVMASTHPKQWNGTTKEITFTIHAPWWKSAWAYSLYAFLFIGCISIGIWLYFYNMKRKHKEEMLLLRIKNLIEQRNQYKKECQPEIKINEEKENVNIKPADADFLNKAIALVERNLNSSGYSVEQLSHDLCMERTGLYKKLTTLMDKSPSLFIRSIRLRKAADLIIEGKLSMGEIALIVGFSSSSYMSKCFQEEFGCKPSEYAQRKLNI